jgi:putative N6-adenine-specific DNA methylase
MFFYQTSGRYFGQVAEGIEEIGREEIEALGAREVRATYRGLHFRADPPVLYRVNYCSRLLTRVLAPLRSFACPDADALYRAGRSIDWTKLFTPKQTFAVDANIANSRISHSRYAAQKLKDAIADGFRETQGVRPSVDPRSPDVWISLRIHADRATIGFDTSGGSLHRRGYRARTVEAPIQETLAAAIVRFSDWEGERPLLDPMCGSGTLLAEALMRAARIPAGYLRASFGFRRLPDFDAGAWRAVKQEADGEIRAVPADLLEGSDLSPEAAAAARANLRLLPGGERVRIGVRAFQEHPGLERGCILCNPPYGIRSGRGEDVGLLLKMFGDFLKRRCSLSTALVYFGERDLVKRVELRPKWKKALRNGGLDGRLVRYDLYEWKKNGKE